MWDVDTKTCRAEAKETWKWFLSSDKDKDSPVKEEVSNRLEFITVHNDECCTLAPNTDDICTDPLGEACCKEERRLITPDDISWTTNSWECLNTYMVEIIFTFGNGDPKHTKTEARTEIVDSDRCCAMCPTNDRFCEACFKETE